METRKPEAVLRGSLLFALQKCPNKRVAFRLPHFAPNPEVRVGRVTKSRKSLNCF